MWHVLIVGIFVAALNSLFAHKLARKFDRPSMNWKKNKKYYSTGKTCTQEIWDKLSTTKSKELIEMRKEIQLSFSIMLERIRGLHTKDTFTLENLDKSLQRVSGETLNSLLEQKTKQLTKSGQIGSKVCYENTFANVMKFGGNMIPIENITVE